MPRAKQRNEEEVQLDEEVKLEEKPVNTPKPAPIPVRKVQKPVRRVSFEQWASRRSIKDSHKAGLRAYVKNPNVPRSLEMWDKVFSDY